MKRQQKSAFGLTSFSTVCVMLALSLGLTTLGTTPFYENAAPSQTEVGQADTVEVAVTDQNLTVPSSLTADSIAFVVSNEGEQPHGFALSGPVDKALVNELAPGEQQVVTTELKAGSYVAYCPLVDGVEAELDVE